MSPRLCHPNNPVYTGFRQNVQGAIFLANCISFLCIPQPTARPRGALLLAQALEIVLWSLSYCRLYQSRLLHCHRLCHHVSDDDSQKALHTLPQSVQDAAIRPPTWSHVEGSRDCPVRFTACNTLTQQTARGLPLLRAARCRCSLIISVNTSV